MKVDKSLKDQVLFIKKFIAEPRTIGSVTPSSPQLAESMLQNVDWCATRVIAELGAGTGVMTRAILSRMERGSELLIFEIEDELRGGLKAETGLEIYADARCLPKMLEKRGAEKADLIVSSLPFAVMPQQITKSVMDGVARSLAADGQFVAFQYSLHMKSAFERIFDSVETRFVVMNIPPAFVYECRGIKKGALEWRRE